MLDISTIEARRSAVNRILSALKYLPFEERQQRADALAAAVGAPLPADLMLNSEQVLELQRNGMEIGAHTVTHPILAKVDAARAEAEIRDSKRTLEALTGSPARSFAYPNGKPGADYLSCHVEMVRSLGFEAAVSTTWGVATPRTDRHELPRFTPWDKTPGRFLLRMLHNTLRTKPVPA
jgi:peptidoglycan/xylan/chitin deacetylase (PgdA/CDA1 family)